MAETRQNNGQVTELENLREQLHAEQRKNAETEQRLRATESAELEVRRAFMPYLLREVEILRGQMEGSDDGE